VGHDGGTLDRFSGHSSANGSQSIVGTHDGRADRSGAAMSIEWTSCARDALPLPFAERVPNLIERIVQKFAPAVPSVRIINDSSIDDAGQFRFHVNDRTGDVQPCDVIVNTRWCRTIYDVVYVLLHEIRHARQFEVLGWETVSAASTQKRFWTELGHQIEEDAAAWAIDTVPLVRPGRNAILNANLSAPSIYRSHRSSRSRLKIGWDL
jgi:hypothetical protein